MITRVMGFVFPTHASLFVTTSIDWYKLWIADTLPLGNIFKQLVYMTGYMLVFFSAGYYIFDKRDL
jgi:ABC-2 type transport system permease protein